MLGALFALDTVDLFSVPDGDPYGDPSTDPMGVRCKVPEGEEFRELGGDFGRVFDVEDVELLGDLFIMQRLWWC